MTVYPQLNVDQESVDAIIHTNHGDLEFVLFEEQAPKTVENFKRLAAKGYYDGVIFHRVIKDFMIQGGDPTGTGMGGDSIYGGAFEDEFDEQLVNLKGALSMANAGPNTNKSQFFIVSAPHVDSQMLQQMPQRGYPEALIEAYAEHGGTPWLDGRHTVFGHLVKGEEVLEAIQAVATNPMDRPVEDVIIESISLIETSES